MNPDMRRTFDHTIHFLRMAAIELRRSAEHAPDIAEQLRHIASQLDTEADELSSHQPPS